MDVKRIFVYAGFVLTVAGCQNASRTHSPPANASGQASPVHQHQTRDSEDKGTALPLLPHMAEHQLQNMRDHLAAVQEIIAAVSAQDFAAAERSANRIGYSKQMEQMCEHMGAGAPGFTALALNFHRTADRIAVAAKAGDSAGTLKAVSTTLQTCVGCHAMYRQEIVDEAAWAKITSEGSSTPAQNQ
jgi:hypothetical protein